MKKLLAMFAVLACVSFVACSDDDDPQGGNQGEAKLSLQSEAVMNFDVDGGKGTILYSLTNPSPSIQLEAKCDATWITDLATGPAVTFQVAANESGEARSTNIEVKYADQSFTVEIKQSVDGGTPAAIETTVNVLQGEYYSDFEEHGIYNYMLYLSKKGLTVTSDNKLQFSVNDNVYALDLYSDVAPSDPMVVPVGTYTVDPSNSCEPGTCGVEYSWGVVTNDKEITADVELVSGTVTVTESGIEATLTLSNGETHHMVYEGSLEMELFEEDAYSNLLGDVTFENVVAEDTIQSYGDILKIGLDVYLVQVQSEAECVVLQLANPVGTGTIVGQYTLLDPSNLNASTWAFFPGIVQDDEPAASWYLNQATEEIAPLAGGTVEIQENEEGDYIYILDVVDDAGNVISGSFICEAEVVEDEDALSNLTEDLDVTSSTAMAMYANYEDLYGVNMNNWVVTIMDVDGDYNGAYVMFDVLAPVASELPLGTFNILEGNQVNSSNFYMFPGTYEQDGEDLYMVGSWYTTMVEGDFTETSIMAPIAGGSITIEAVDADNWKITLDCVDDAGNAITGVYNAPAYDQAEMSTKKQLKAPTKEMFSGLMPLEAATRSAGNAAQTGIQSTKSIRR